MSSFDTLALDLDATYARLFVPRHLPELVFQPAVESCAWITFDGVCCIGGWTLLHELARGHGDASVHIIGLDLHEQRLLVVPTGSDPEAYGAICDDELVGSDVVRWWGSSGQWGIDGSRGLEIAVAGQVARRRWPQGLDCRVLSIDSAMRLCRGKDGVRPQLLTNYDSMSWDPAVDHPEALSRLLALCSDVVADRVDPVVAIRGLVELLDRVPKFIRRIAATDQLHRAWSRTAYLMIDAQARSPWGELLLAQNDRNHERHSAEERPLVVEACKEIADVSRRDP